MALNFKTKLKSNIRGYNMHFAGYLRNYLFCGNADAATRAAIIYSLLGSCKAAGVNPSEWLEDVLSKIYPYTKEKRNLEELLPHLWKK